MRTQTAVLLQRFSNADPHKALEVCHHASVPEPTGREVLVRVRLRCVDPADVLALRGLYPGIHQDLPTVPGFEGVGYVEDVGPETSHKFSRGMRVVGAAFDLKKKMGRPSCQLQTSEICSQGSSLVASVH